MKLSMLVWGLIMVTSRGVVFCFPSPLPSTLHSPLSNSTLRAHLHGQIKTLFQC